ncbi:hypothetical protein ACH42_12670 [Endozoicomonas sp. (ex Bugula neritina AB1)]|nr:hypothetical protein ACH42_12670 [Endozoicomonas sp. (ex Bugula neritina AB1)]
MKISTSIWGKSNKVSDLVVLTPGDFIARLWCCLFFVLISSCTTWPDSAERVLSLPNERLQIPENINREYLQYLLGIVDQRFSELDSVGASVCFPGKMLKLNRLHSLVKHEMDGNLFLDAKMNVEKVFDLLNSVRTDIEKYYSSNDCFRSFHLGHFYERSNEREEIVFPEFSPWFPLNDIENLMERK